MQSCLICDDHAMMLHALSSVIAAAWPDASITRANDFPSAWMAAESPQELILTDLSMPGCDPVEGVAKLRAIAHSARIVVVTANEDDEVLLELFDLGIDGFVPKSASVEVMEAAIRLILAGGSYVPPRVLALAGNRGTSGSGLRKLPADVARLTDRQIEVLRLVAQGAPNKEIARGLNLSPATVKAHVAAIIAAFETSNRTEAAYLAREHGLI